MTNLTRVVELAGGIGGARLAGGLQEHLGPGLKVIVNVGDDLERYGLYLTPDHDTLMYTLAGIENTEAGWGLEDETWHVSGQLAVYGEETWFRLGDRDMAAHIVRTHRLREGQRLTEIQRQLQQSLGLESKILPMTDDVVRTELHTDDGWLEFQEYYVREHSQPVVHETRFVGIEGARTTPEVNVALAEAEAIVLGPSNPFVSIGPILDVPGLREAIHWAKARGVPVVAVTPIIGGRAVRGPADRMLASLGHDVSAAGVAKLYRGLVTGFVVDTVDAELEPAIAELGMATLVTNTFMGDRAGRARLAGEVLEFVRTLLPKRDESSR